MYKKPVLHLPPRDGTLRAHSWGGSFNICDTPTGFASRPRCEKRDEISQMKKRERERERTRPRWDSKPGATLRDKTSSGIHADKTGFVSIPKKKKKKKKKKCQLTLAFVSFVIYYT